MQDIVLEKELLKFFINKYPSRVSYLYLKVVKQLLALNKSNQGMSCS